MIDASIQRWRRGDYESRRKAVIVLAAVVGSALISVVLTYLIVYGVRSLPYLDTPTFLVTLAVMAVELSRDIVMSRPRGWAWAWQYAEPSSRPMAVACGRTAPLPAAVQHFGLYCRNRRKP